ncbi:MAG: GRP family sugar transporter [Candidatus Paceibacterota bacterium]
MPTWLMYGLVSSLFWGTYAVVSKIVTSEKYLKVQSTNASLLMFVGIMLVFFLFFLTKTSDLSNLMRVGGFALIALVITYVVFALKQTGVVITPSVLILGSLSGALWAAGMIFTFFAFSAGAEAAKLVPIYNTNTLIAVFLGIAMLHELPAPDARIKVITGAVLIVVGSILVSK